MIRPISVKLKNTLLFLVFLLSFAFPAYCADKTLAILPFAFYGDQPKSYIYQGLKSMFVSRLSGEGISIINDDTLFSLLNEQEKKGITGGKKAIETAGRAGADYAIFGSITSFGAGYSLDLSIINTAKGLTSQKRVTTAVDREGGLVTSAAEAAHRFRAIIEGKPYFPPGAPAYESDREERETVREAMGFKRKNIYRARRRRTSGSLVKDYFIKTTDQRPFNPSGAFRVKNNILGFDIGDLNGDGEEEFAVISDDTLFIYKRKGSSFSLLDKINSAIAEEFIHVSVGDADHNGKAEIYAVARYGIRGRTTVWEWNGKFNKIHRQYGHMTIAGKSESGRPILLFQQSRTGYPFYGGIYRMEYENQGKPVKADLLPGLKNTQFYTLTISDLDGDGAMEYICLGKDSKLHVLNGNDGLLWKSAREIGGTNNAFTMIGPTDSPEDETRIEINIGVTIMDIDGDGKKEVIAAENIPIVANLGHFKVYTQSRLLAYSLEGTKLIPSWESGTSGYCITGLVKLNKTLYIAAQKAKFNTFKKGSGSIMWLE